MSAAKSLLIELLVEELPPKSLKELGEKFETEIVKGLRDRQFLGQTSVSSGFATPRRLAVHISHVLPGAPSQEIVERLMPASVALDGGGALTQAALKRCDKVARAGLAAKWSADKLRADDGPDQLYVAGEEKNRFLFLRTISPGQPLRLGIQAALKAALGALPIRKEMSYQIGGREGQQLPLSRTTVRFVRPAHGLVVLHGAELLDGVHVLGLEARRETQGHRFEAQLPLIPLQNADHYERVLRDDGAVIASFAHRRAEIVRQLQHAASALELKPIDDDALLDEVTALVERPNVVLCEFEPQFLAVPPECLILTMKANQKYFPLLDATGALTNKFLVVSNIRPDDSSAVVKGNVRVVRPRLADAKFFFDQDRRKSLESRIGGLDQVVYHAKLGSMGERVHRVRAIASVIGIELGGPALAAQAERAALLAKADLLSDMVGEFPELQGVMGGYYARHDGETEAVAQAIEDHYRPRFAGDALPRSEVGLVVALADKLETLVGLFGIGQTPTGDKDPFALRRHALGVLRMLVERSLPIDLPALVAMAQAPFAAVRGWSEVTESVLQFFHERLAVLLREQGSTAHEVDAVLGLKPARMSEIPQRLAAVRSFAGMPESASLAAANKRITNILKKSDADGASKVEPGLFAEHAERALHSALNDVAPRADALFERRDYTASLRELATLRAPVDAFFDHVMVNADDAKLRANRLALLSALHRTMNRVADLSRLVA
jgi:glycyl-tRNA synthetase beta chain